MSCKPMLPLAEYHYVLFFKMSTKLCYRLFFTGLSMMLMLHYTINNF